MRIFFVFFLMGIDFTFGQNERALLYERAIEHGYRHDFKASEMVFSQIIEQFPMDSMAYFDRAIMRENLGDTLGAISDLTKQISIDHENADNYFLRGILFQKTGQLNLALTDFKIVHKLDFGNADAHFFAAQVIMALHQNSITARRQLKHCLKVNPAHFEALELLRVLKKHKI